MLDIKKIGKNFYLVGGEYTANTYSQAVVIANQGTEIKGFEIDCMKVNLRSYLRFKAKGIVKSIWYCINYPFKKLESWM